MKKLLFFLIFLFNLAFVWEWNGLKEDMYFEYAVKIIGRTTDVKTKTSRIGDKKIKIIEY